MPHSLSIAQLRYTKTQFEALNPTPSDGQLCIETDTDQTTVGDGVSAYRNIRGNYVLSGTERRSADDVYSAQVLSDGRDEVGSGGGGGGESGTVAQRTGSAIAFDQAAIYNTAASPSSGTITYDLTGATFGVEVIAYFNHASLPTFPSGTEVIGTWDDSEVNEVRFVYGASGEVVATIRSNNTGDYVSPTTNLRPTTDQSTSGTTAVGITGMSMTLKANKSYRVQGKLRVQGTGTGGLKFQATLGAASPAVVLWLHLLGRSLATSNTGLLSDQMNVVAGYNTLSGIAMSPNTSAAGYVFFDGTIDVDNADVTFELAFASATSGQTATVFRTASHLEVTEI